MSDPTAGSTPYERREQREFDLAKLRLENSAIYVGRMIWLISLIAGGISLIVVLSVVIIAVVGMLHGEQGKIPDVLSNWGGIILGFYFGQFVNLVKDYMGIVNFHLVENALIVGAWAKPAGGRVIDSNKTCKAHNYAAPLQFIEHV
jgi:hypothetical protein